jgi:glycosyltransferase involved in cell wall biosynthesis
MIIKTNKIIFLSLSRIDNLNERGIYHDLLRSFVLNGYDVTVLCPIERSEKIRTRILKLNNLTIIQVRIFNIQKCNIYEKTLSTLTINFFFKLAIKKFASNKEFDLILYSTPPITFVNLIFWLKTKNNAVTYLLLKDIFPQNAIDLGYFKEGGLIHKYFKYLELKLYKISDRIGCMSQANLHYLENNFNEINDKLEINPNSIDLKLIPEIKLSKNLIREKWNIPQNSVVLLYGGNLGKPQGLNFLLDIISSCNNYVKNAFFLIVGDGTEYNKIQLWFNENKPQNAVLLKKIPKHEFSLLANSCDIGLVLLRKEFTVPNFPSRILTYLENKLPILAITDLVSDVGLIAENFGFGKRIEYGDLESSIKHISLLTNDLSLCKMMGVRGFEYLIKHYDVNLSYKMIDFFLNNKQLNK